MSAQSYGLNNDHLEPYQPSQHWFSRLFGFLGIHRK